MKKKVITFGEIMLRLSTPGFTRFVQTQTFEATFGGGEANVAVSLANYGYDSYFITKLPKHEIGQAALNHLRRFGVKDDFIVRGGERIGIYFLETGASQRPSKVIYDRSNSSIVNLNKDEVQWEKVFENADWFHWTGITPALGKSSQETLHNACLTAKKMGVKISADLNYRAKLWTTAEAQSVMIPLMEYVDVCIANEEDSEKSLGIKPENTNVNKGELNLVGYKDLLRKLKTKFGFETVAITLRESYSANRNGWSAIMIDEKNCKDVYHSKKYEIEIVDRVGGGDSFASGLIYALLEKQNTQEALEFAVAASCLKHTIHGDFNLVSIEEVEKLSKGNSSGRVER